MSRAKPSSQRRREKGRPQRINRGGKREVHPQGRYLIPGTNQAVDYATYRAKTGDCETCGAPMDSHPQCEGCGILCGEGHEVSLSPYRGHGLCYLCIKSWQTQDRAVGRETTWEEFHSPKLSLFEQEVIDV